MKREGAFILLEYVIALPVLLLLILGIFDVCVLWNTKAALQQGVETGLRCLTSPESACYKEKHEEEYRYLYRELGYEYQHPEYAFTASERWLEVPSLELSDFRASVLDSVSLLEAGHTFYIKRKRYEAAYAYWEEVQRLPELSFSKNSGVQDFRSPEVHSLREARGVSAIQTSIDKNKSTHIMKVMQYSAPDGDPRAPCVQSWNKAHGGGSCSPLETRVLLHLKAQGAGNGKANLFVAIVSSQRKHVKKHAPQWKSLGGQRYGAANANFFPRGVSLKKNKEGDFVFLSGLSERDLPTEFTKDYNRLLRLNDGEALWIKVEWESGHPLHLESIEYYRSQYRYRRWYDPVLKEGTQYLPHPDVRALAGGKAPFLDPASIRVSGEEDGGTVCAYSLKEAEAQCVQHGTDCHVVPGSTSLCLPSGTKRRVQVSCVPNYGVKRNSKHSLEALFRQCKPDVGASVLPLHLRAPVFTKKEISFPESIQLVKQSCLDTQFTEASALPEHLERYADLRYQVERKRVFASSQGLDPAAMKASSAYHCPEFQLKERTIALEEADKSMHSMQLEQSCSGESVHEATLNAKRYHPDSFIELQRNKKAIAWQGKPPVLCEGDELIKRLRVRGQWKLIADTPSASDTYPQMCKDPLIECRKDTVIHGVSYGVNEGEALRRSYDAAVAHAPFLRRLCKSKKKCFSSRELSYGNYRMEARIDVPLKSLFILQSLGILDDSYTIEYKASDRREDLSLFTPFD